jgi:hypothetical protein
MSALIGIVHLMVTIQGRVVELPTNLASNQVSLVVGDRSSWSHSVRSVAAMSIMWYVRSDLRS